MTTIEPGAVAGTAAAAGGAGGAGRAGGAGAGGGAMPVSAQTLAPAAPTAAPVARPLRIGLVSISDRASTGVYEDKGIPSLVEWLGSALKSPWEQETRLIPDEAAQISATLVELVDEVRCDLVLTTGGTGPSRRDVTPEATLAVATKEMPGFGEQMRQISLNFVPPAILSRQTAVIRGKSQILNLSGQPK